MKGLRLAIAGLMVVAGMAATPTGASALMKSGVPTYTRQCTNTPDGTCWTCTTSGTRRCYKNGLRCTQFTASSGMKYWVCD